MVQLANCRLGSIEIALPDLLNSPWRHVASDPGHSLTTSHPSVWRGVSPARTSTPAS